jgi:mannosyltransferase OCH1-like enzyme
MAIPKIIHYCWFGDKPLPDISRKCIESWRKFFPAYEIKEWNTSNYDVNKIYYTKQTYKAGWYSFLTDYARLDVLYAWGGVVFRC